MTPYERSGNRGRLWYAPARVDRWYHGVFEGGGARAVAYPGALAALAESRAWLKSVTGSSAGAITAAFVGSGAEADRAADFTVEMFKLVDVSRANGFARLVRRGGYFPGDELRDWLDEQLANELARAVGRSLERPVSFATMFEISGIETFVVATDLSLNQPIVFSHLLTPRCSVAEAVVASSSTPVAFESRLLAVSSADGTGPRKHHTIVDGGLWSNFPTYVLTDAAFRRRYGLEPARLDESEIIALRLSEEVRDEIQASRDIEFRAPNDPVDALEWSKPAAPKPYSRADRWLAALLAPFALVARALDRTAARDRGRWPRAPRRSIRRAVDAVDGLFGALAPLPVAVAVWLIVAGGTIAGVVRMLTGLGESPLWAIAAAAAVVLFVLPLLALLGIGLVANSLLLKPARATFYGLLTTYAAAGRSRPWHADEPYVVTLEVPNEVSAISFGRAIDLHRGIIAEARRTTLAHLQRTLRSIA